MKFLLKDGIIFPLLKSYLEMKIIRCILPVG